MIKKLLKLVGNKIKNVTRSGKKNIKPAVSTPATSKTARHNSGHSSKPAQHSNPKSTSRSGKQKSHWDRKNPRKTRSSQSKKGLWTLDKFQVDPAEGQTRFHDLDLPLSIMHAVADLKFQYCTPIQAISLPDTIKGNDLIGRAQTGTGKSAAFLISIFTRLTNSNRKNNRINGAPRALIIAPTRELVMQICNDARGLSKYTNFRTASVFGGVDYQKQKNELQNNRVDLIAATPGRLLDYLRQKIVRLDQVEIMVLDEADRMLDMGFIPDVRRIVHHTPEKHKRQTMMFSATITNEVQHLASQWCTKPSTVEIEPEQVAVDTVDQIVYLTTSNEKYAVLYNLLTNNNAEKVLIFTNRKDEARKLTDRLKRNKINCTMLSGDVQQKQRMSRLESFKAGKVKVLVATDVAGRGIHIDGISHVINYTLPYEPEDYVHRIGRTGRAGATGISISFACDEGAFYLPEIEEFIGRKLDCQQPEDALLVEPPKGSSQPQKNRNRSSNYRGHNKPRRKYHKPSSQSRSSRPKKHFEGQK